MYPVSAEYSTEMRRTVREAQAHATVFLGVFDKTASKDAELDVPSATQYSQPQNLILSPNITVSYATFEGSGFRLDGKQYLFLARFFVWSKRYKLYSTTYGVSEWIRTTEFLDDEIILTDHTSVSKLKYSNIKTIKEKGNVVMIFMNNNMALRLYKDAFVEGSWEECKEKINAMLK